MGSISAPIEINPAAMAMCPARIERYWTLMGMAPAAIEKFPGNAGLSFVCFCLATLIKNQYFHILKKIVEKCQKSG